MWSAKFVHGTISAVVRKSTKKSVIDTFSDFERNKLPGSQLGIAVKFETCDEIKTVLVKTISEDLITGWGINYEPVSYSIKKFKNLYIAIVSLRLFSIGEKLFLRGKEYDPNASEYPVDIQCMLTLMNKSPEEVFSAQALCRLSDASRIFPYEEIPISLSDIEGVYNVTKITRLEMCPTFDSFSLFQCCITKKYYLKEQVIEVDNSYYSDEGLNTVGVSRVCSSCGKDFVAKSRQEIKYSSCKECFSKIPRCVICGDIASDTISGISMCEVHAKDNHCGLYHTNTSHKSPKFLGTPEKDFPLYLGVELEIDVPETLKQKPVPGLAIAIATRDLQEEKVEFTHDSSLTPLGFEMISQPKTIERWHEDREKYKNVFQSFVECGMRGHDAWKAGFHIHVSDKAFGKDAPRVFTRLYVLIYRHFTKVLGISRRNRNYMQLYARYRPGLVDIPAFNESTLEYLQIFKQYQVGLHAMLAHDLELPTFEFRLFRSTLNIETFMATLDFVYGLCKYAKEHDFNTCNSVTWNELKDAINSEEFNRYSDRILKIANSREDKEASIAGDDDVVEVTIK